MPWLRRLAPSSGWVAIVSAGFVAAALALAACSDDDDDARDADEGATPAEATDPIRVDVTAALELDPPVDPDFIPAVLADDEVTTDELTDAYARYIGCIEDGGGAGLYAFDPSLDVFYNEWTLPDDGDAAALNASCSRDFLGDLIERHRQANPPAGDIAERQRASVLACLEAISPEVAAAIPEGAFTVDTTGVGLNLADLQLDPAALGAEAGEATAVQRCFGTLGATTTPFGAR